MYVMLYVIQCFTPDFIGNEYMPQRVARQIVQENIRNNIEFLQAQYFKQQSILSLSRVSFLFPSAHSPASDIYNH